MGDTPTYTPDLRGFVTKYNVYRVDPESGKQGDLVDGPTFTLRPYDPHARVALRAYADSVAPENRQLCADLHALANMHEPASENDAVAELLLGAVPGGESAGESKPLVDLTDMNAMLGARVFEIMGTAKHHGVDIRLVASNNDGQPVFGFIASWDAEKLEAIKTTLDAMD